jgi:class 3 adenylate cyclase
VNGSILVASKETLGNVVQLAARVCAHAEPGRMLIVEMVQDQCPGKEQLFSDLGEIAAKGFDHLIRIYEVQWAEA